MARILYSQCRGPGFGPGWGTKSYIPQLVVYILQLRVLCAIAGTWCSQINLKKFLSRIAITF